MQSAQPNVRGVRKFLYIVSFFVSAGVIAFVGYVFFQQKRLDLSTAAMQKSTNTLQADIDLAQKDAVYSKYAAAKAISADIKPGGRGDRLSRVMSVFSTLQQLGGGGTRFSDFNLGFSTLTMKGVVRDLKLVYGKGGVIDQFNALDFVKNIKISQYTKSEDGYTFTLTADVLLNNVSTK